MHMTPCRFSVAEQPYTYSEIEAIAAYLKSKTRHNPTIGIICGSGLGGLADQVDDAEDFDYSSIPKFPVSTGREKNQTPRFLEFFASARSRGETRLWEIERKDGRLHERSIPLLRGLSHVESIKKKTNVEVEGAIINKF